MTTFILVYTLWAGSSITTGNVQGFASLAECRQAGKTLNTMQRGQYSFSFECLRQTTPKSAPEPKAPWWLEVQP